MRRFTFQLTSVLAVLAASIEAAVKEADIIIGRAELERERMLEDAQERLTHLLVEIDEQKRQRAQFLAQLKGVVDTHRKLIEIAEQDVPAVEENLAVMRKKSESASGQKQEGAQKPSPFPGRGRREAGR